MNSLSRHDGNFSIALVAACTKKANAGYIIIRDDRFLVKDSPVKVVSPFEFSNV